MGSNAFVLLSACAVPVIAQASGFAPDWAAQLAASGPIGAVLLWFMFRNEKRLRYLSSAVDRMNRAALVLAIATKRFNSGEREVAEQIIREIDEDEKRATREREPGSA